LIRPRRKPRRGRVIDRRYKGWIASLPCLVCEQDYVIAVEAGIRGVSVMEFQRGQTEVAHVGARGLGQKCSGRETLPLCAEHHRLGRDSHHRLGRKFFEHHGLDKAALIRELNARYEAEVLAA